MECTSERKKQLRNEYKELKDAGGVYKITNTITGRYLLQGEINVRRFRSRYEFSRKTGACVLLKLQDDWDKYGAEAFAFEVLEEIEKKEDQTIKEFKEDIKLLEEMWAEKFDPDKAY